MSVPIDLKNKKLIKVCPGCAVAHMAKCREVAEGSAEEDPCPLQNRLDSVLSTSKRLCHINGDLTFAHCLILLYHILVTVSGVVMHLVRSLIPIVEYMFLIIIYALECSLWAWKEEKIYLKILKGSASVTAVLFLSYIAYILMVSFFLPTLTLLYTLYSKGRSLVG